MRQHEPNFRQQLIQRCLQRWLTEQHEQNDRRTQVNNAVSRNQAALVDPGAVLSSVGTANSR